MIVLIAKIGEESGTQVRTRAKFTFEASTITLKNFM
jgi:hypothetical protein